MISQQALTAVIAALVAFVTGGALQRIVERWSRSRDAARVKGAEAAEHTAEATRLDAETDRIEARALVAAMNDLRRRLDACEEKHAAAEQRSRTMETVIASMQRQIDADALLVAKLAEKAEGDETLIRGLRSEVDELRRSIRGVPHAAAKGVR